MNYKLKKVITNSRVIILLVVLALALVAINPKPWVKGVTINNVLINSSAMEAGIQQPAPSVKPVNRERILAIDNMPIKGIRDYYNYENKLEINQSVQIKTTKGLYRLKAKEDGLGLRISNAQKTNIRKGLDLQGGTRVLLQPESKLQQEDLQSLIDTMQERLNVYGLSDLIIREASDLTGNQYIVVEIAGANEEDIRNLLEKQGKFEAQIANKTVFVGGKDIVFVCRSANCAGIDPNTGCYQENGQNICRFRFSISITPEAAQKQAEATGKLEVIGDSKSANAYLSEPLELYLDDSKVNELSIGSELKGSTTTDIQISGSGIGNTQQQAVLNTFANMKRLQTVLITGSLPVKMNIVKIDAISPLLGNEFLKNALILGALALASVVAVIFAKYRKLAVAIPMVLSSIAEIVLLLGVAALIGWNIDLAAVAGIIVAIGTGVNDNTVITDETLRRGQRDVYDWKQRIKNAFFIIMAAYSTIAVSMLPLVFAGAGLLKGFAIITLIGASIGVFITRPAYSRVIEILVRE